MCPIVHNYGASPTTTPSYIRVRAVVWACGRGQTDTHTDTQTRVTTVHFASSATHAKCNNEFNICPMSWSSQVSTFLLLSLGEYVIIIHYGPYADLTLVLDRAYLKKVLESFLNILCDFVVTTPKNGI